MRPNGQARAGCLDSQHSSPRASQSDHPSACTRSCACGLSILRVFPLAYPGCDTVTLDRVPTDGLVSPLGTQAQHRVTGPRTRHAGIMRSAVFADRGLMRSRHDPFQRLFVWLAFAALGLASLMPVVSQLAVTHPMAMGGGMPAMADMAEMVADCHGHIAHGTEPPHSDGHGSVPMDACGYCSLLAHFGGLPPLPVVVMRPPFPAADAPLALFSTRPHVALWLLDAAPRGPPLLT